MPMETVLPSETVAVDRTGFLRRRGTIYALRLLRKSPGAMVSVAILSVILFVTTFAPLLATRDPGKVSAGAPVHAPDGAFYFGTDRLGRDVYSRVLFGSRLSLPIGILAVAFSLTVGSTVGLATGFFGGRVDAIGARLIDIMLGFPSLMLALLIITMFGIGIENVIIAVGISGTPRFARIVRGQTLSVRQNVYIEAARAIGATGPQLLRRHVLPNVRGAIIVLGTLSVGGAILQASALGFLGLGVQPPAPEWGTMLAEGKDLMRHAPWLMLFPGMMLFLTVISINLLGDYLREIFDPRLRSR
ncbi:MAG: ABC transporter permease [Armatimonadetes bacterium]|nr:ABC transporter permease [Armatimonadota bacterium]